MIQHVFNYRSGTFLCVGHSQHWRNIFPTPWLLLYDPNSHVIIRLAALWRGIDCCNERKLKLIFILGDHHATCQSSKLAICASPNCVVGNALQVVNLNGRHNVSRSSPPPLTLNERDILIFENYTWFISVLQRKFSQNSKEVTSTILCNFQVINPRCIKYKIKYNTI